jgi:hypothetical protein
MSRGIADLDAARPELLSRHVAAVELRAATHDATAVEKEFQAVGL